MPGSTDSASNLLARPLKTWPAWLSGLIAVVVVLAQGLFTQQFGELRAAVKENSGELVQLRLALEGAKRMQADVEDHEARIRALERDGK